VVEVSIGHALIADALALGISETVRDYQRCIQAAFAASAARADLAASAASANLAASAARADLAASAAAESAAGAALAPPR
jgi:hypothetical protein